MMKYSETSRWESYTEEAKETFIDELMRVFKEKLRSPFIAVCRESFLRGLK